jgi:predicted secreted protein
MATNGNNILIYVNGAMVAGTRSDEVQSGCDTIEIANPTSGDWRQFITGRKEWSVNTSWLLPAASDLGRLLQVGTTVTIRILGRGAANGLTGTAIVKTCKITNTRGNISNGSFAFQGTGALTQET